MPPKTVRKCPDCPYRLGLNDPVKEYGGYVFKRPSETLTVVAGKVLLADLTALKVVTIWLAVIASVAFFVYQPSRNSVMIKFMVQLMPHEVWAGLFLLYGILRLADIGVRRVRWVCFANQILGASLWLLFILSGIVAPPPTSLYALVLVPLVIEVWMMAAELSNWSQRDAK